MSLVVGSYQTLYMYICIYTSTDTGDSFGRQVENACLQVLDAGGQRNCTMGGKKWAGNKSSLVLFACTTFFLCLPGAAMQSQLTNLNCAMRARIHALLAVWAGDGLTPDTDALEILVLSFSSHVYV